MVGLIDAIDLAKRERGAALMGVLNTTPDSFSDGGRFLAGADAELRVRELCAEGADLIDIGGESSRPGAVPVEPAEQIDRITPGLTAALSAGAWVSIDTTQPRVAEYALARGAHAINDVSCLADPDLATVTARAGAILVLMHSRGTLGSMAGFSNYPADAYDDVVAEVLAEWSAARDRAVVAGMPRERILLDPGLGFAKSAAQSLTLLGRLQELSRAQTPVVVGPSRKSFITAVDPAPPDRRLGGTIAACLIAADRGASLLRVHDVAAVRQALLVARAVDAPSRGGSRPSSQEPSHG